MRIGVDLGGTKIEAIAIDDDGQERVRERIPTPTGSYDQTVAAIANLVAAVETKAGDRAARIGVGTPGALSPATGKLKNSNSLCLNGQPLDRDLATALGRPVRLANDANCFALSEATDGAGSGYDVVFGVIVGTGTGGGVVVHGHVLTGPNAIAGEWGHNPLPWPQESERPGPSCYCGRSGCIETFLSGPGMRADHAAFAGEPLDAARIHERARDGDFQASETMARYVDRMARALGSVINLLDPDVIVLGGGMSNMEELYHAVPRAWGRYIFSDRVSTPLVRARHGDSSGVRGAAWLWDMARFPKVR